MKDANSQGTYAMDMTRAQSENYRKRRTDTVTKRRSEVAALDAGGKLATPEQRQAYGFSQAVGLATIDNDVRITRKKKSP